MTCLPSVARGSGQKCGESVGVSVLPPSLLLPAHVLRPGPAHPAFPSFRAACEEKECVQARHCHRQGKKISEKSVLYSICLIQVTIWSTFQDLPRPWLESLKQNHYEEYFSRICHGPRCKLKETKSLYGVRFRICYGPRLMQKKKSLYGILFRICHGPRLKC
jgi:hypothetical protein